jgi:hypothetical protein
MTKKISKGSPIEELVKGSLDYTMQMIRDAFRSQFPYSETGPTYYVEEIFVDHAIVKTYGPELKTDEYYRVAYTRSGEAVSFAGFDGWEIVQLAYEPQTAITESKKKSGKRIEENIAPGKVALLEAKDEEKKTRRIRINDLMVADEVNGNKRLYSREVIEAMVADWQPYLRESRGQGRLMILTGEVEHPSDKKSKRPEFLETVVRWNELDWNGKSLSIEGDLILTSKGRDVEILMEAGVNPGGSIRGIGESKIEKVGSEKIERVQWVSMNAADLVGDPSFVNAAALQESINQQGDEAMNLEELLKLFREHPEAFAGITEAQIKKMGDEQLKKMEETLRSKLGIGADADIAKALDESMDKARKFDESQKRGAITAAISEATKELPYGEKLNKLFVESFDGQEFADADGVKKFAEGKRKEYGALAAAGVLKGMGFDEKTKSIKVIGDVLEMETGTPEFGHVAFELTESLRKKELRPAGDLRKREDRAAIFTVQLLEKFDKMYQRQLLAESKHFEEAELSTDLNIPYSISRAVIAEAFPNLVAANIFDVGVMEQSPTRLYYEAFAGETGYEVVVTDEVETGGAEGEWYDLANKNITPGTMTVTSNPAGTTYTEGTDYIVDYELGKIWFLAAGSIGANDILASYTYRAIRKGENAAIKRAKTTFSNQTIEAAADRLATYISDEAIKFSRSQIGWDAVTRTMSNLIREIRRDIDRRLMEKALMAALSVANNSGGTWDISDSDESDLVAKLGAAAVLVYNRFYTPSFVLASVTNAERLSNWTGFQRDGFPNALLQAAGFQNMVVKGMPVFASPLFRDGNFLVGARDLVHYRTYSPMIVKGPFPTFDSGELVAAEQYYAEEYNASLAPIGGKGAVVKTQA